MKPPLARTMKWERYSGYLGDTPGIYVRTRAGNTSGRRLTGPVGLRLYALGETGQIIFLDKAPGWQKAHIMLAGYPDGVVVSYFSTWNKAESEIVTMCSSFLKRVVGGVGKVRWARVKAVA